MRNAILRQVSLKGGLKMPRLGLGTWTLGERRWRRPAELRALRAGLERGVRLFDTAEMYGDGAAEDLLGEALCGVDRDSLFLVSKVLPSSMAQGHTRKSLEATLGRLRTSYLDLYLYHWIGETPFPEVAETMESLVAAGLIRAWGVSNFDVRDLGEMLSCGAGVDCAVNQVLYHLGSRGIEHSLLPLMKSRGVVPMAYSPLAQAGALRRGLPGSGVVREVASRHGISPMQVLLAFVLARPGMVAIPRSSSEAHVLEIVAAGQVDLGAEDLALLKGAFPAPSCKEPLEVC
ncbi:MAG: aldo/keto reductase [Succinivibrionaceae bacterium]|nr:aldo/keto reductase [Succinivibrionaceae bacterium]